MKKRTNGLKENFMRIYNLRTYIKGYGKILIIATIGIILVSLLAMPIPYIMGRIVDLIFIQNKGTGLFYKILAFIVIIYLARYVLSLLAKYLFVKISANVVNNIKIAVIKKTMKLPMDFFNENDKGYILSRISECNNIGSIFSPSIISIFIGFFDFVLSFIALLSISIKITMPVVFLIPVYFVVIRISSSSLTKTMKKSMEDNAFVSAELFETLNSVEEIKLLNAYDKQINKIKHRIDKTIKSSIKQGMSMTTYLENTGILNSLANVLILLIVGLLIINNEVSLGIYTAVSGYAAKILGNVQSIASMGITLKPIFISIERVNEYLSLDDENKNRVQLLEEDIETVTMENIDFMYKNTKGDMILNNFSYQFKSGDKILITGRNGSGKSTLIKLLVSLYSPNKGNIFYNNQNLDQLNILKLREKIGVISQNIFLFSGTLLENILYSCNDKDVGDVIYILKQYDLEYYINSFNDGLDTIISNGGSNVSGGQKQLIALLRVIISKKGIIILDEPISSMDYILKEKIGKIITEMKLANIIIIISHNDNFKEIEKKIILK